MPSPVRAFLSLLFVVLGFCVGMGQTQGSETINAQYTPIAVPNAVAYSPDSLRIAVGAGNGEGAVQVTVLSSGAVTCLPTAATNSVNALSFSPDGSQLLVAGSGFNASGNPIGVLEIWNVQTAQFESSLATGATGGINSAAFSPDGSTIAAGGVTSAGAGALEFWRSGGRSPIRLLTGNTGGVNSLAFSSDSTQLIVGGLDPNSAGLVELWVVSSASRTGTIPNFSSAGVFSVALSPNGWLAAIGGQTSNGSAVVELRNVTSGASVSVLPTYLANTVTAVAFNPSGTILANGGISNTGGTIELWTVSTGSSFASLNSPAGSAIHSLCFSSDGQTLLDGGEGQTTSGILYGLAERWAVSSQKLLQSIASDDSYGATNAVTFSKDGKTVAAGGSGSFGGLLQLWNPVSGNITALPTAASTVVNSVAYSPDGSILADGGVSEDSTGMYGSVVELWSTAKNTLISSIASGADLGVDCVAFSPDGKSLAVGGDGSNGGVVELWDVATSTALASLATAASGGVFSISFSPDGTMLAVGGWTGTTGTVEIWNVSTKKLLQTLGTKAAQVTAVGFSPDGKTLSVSGAGEAAGVSELWTVSTGKLEWSLPLAANTYGVTGSAFTASGRALLLSTGTNLQGFDLANGSMLSTFTDGQLSLSVAPTGTSLAFGTFTGGLALAVNPLAGYVPVSSVSINPKSVVGGQSAVGTVALSQAAPVGGAVVSLTGTASVVSVPPSITIPAGATTTSFSVSTLGVDHSTAASVMAGIGSDVHSAPLTVTPASLLTWSASSLSVVGGESVKLKATLDGLAGPSGITMTLVGTDPAIAIPAYLSVLAGTSSSVLTVSTLGVSAKRSVKVSITQGAVTKTVSISILPASVSTFTVSPNSVLGGTTTQGVVTLTGVAGPSGESIAITANSTYVVVPHTVVVAEGGSQAVFIISTKAVPANKDVVITAAAGGASKTASMVVTPPALTSESVSPASLVGGSPATGTITISSAAPVGGLAVKLSSTSAAGVVPVTAVVPSGKTTGTFTIRTLPVGKVTTITIGAAFSGVTKSASLTIIPPSPKSLTISPAVLKGGLNATGTVTLTSPAPSGGYKLTLTSGSMSASVPTAVTVAAGRTSTTFVIKSSKVSSSTSVTVSGTAGGVTVSGSFTIH